MSDPRPHLILIGYRGCGKSTVGRLVAQRVGRTYYDTDELLESRANRTIAAIFAVDGESHFRDLESATLAELCSGPPAVIATGGGAILRPQNRDLIRSFGFVVWLTADVETIAARLANDPTTTARRPSLTVGGRHEIALLLHEREPLYRELADLSLNSAEQSPEQLAAAILAGWSPSR